MQYYFNINYNCNSRCTFCAADFNGESKLIELSLHDFQSLLAQRKVCSQDTIIINGGEPTVHTDFLAILDSARQTQAQVVLFTNGQKFAEKSFVDAVVSVGDIFITIPVFSADTKQHDALTGVKGNFDRLVSGFSRLNYHLQKKTPNLAVEIKLLMSKTTAPNNVNIMQFFEEKFPKAFSYSMNPLLFSQKVRDRKDIFFANYTEMQQDMYSVLRFAQENCVSISCSALPLCIIPKPFRQFYISSNLGEEQKGCFYADPYGQQERHENAMNREHCKECLYISQCQGFFCDYIDIFGTDEIQPIKDVSNE